MSIQVSWETHPELYRDHRKALEFCRSINLDPNEAVTPEQAKPVIFHTQWTGSPFGRKQLMTCKAFLTTQNLYRCRLVVWVDKVQHNRWTAPLLGMVEFREFNPEIMRRNTPLSHSTEKQLGVSFMQTDVLRMLALAQFGGCWIDMDTVLLRDFSPLLQQEFFYQWGNCLGVTCGGIIRLLPGSGSANAILDAFRQKPLELGPTKELFDYVRPQRERPWSVWPCAWFNTEWNVEPGFRAGDPEWVRFIHSAYLKTTYSNEMFDGAFAWHYHGGWAQEPELGSKWCIVEEMVNRRFAEMFGR